MLKAALLSLLLACSASAFQPLSSRGTTGLPAARRLTRAAPSSTRLHAAEAILADASYNLAAGSACIGLVCGALEDLKDADGQKLLTAKPFGALAVLLAAFGAFIAFQVMPFLK